MPRFIPTRSNTGIPAISDRVRNRMVALVFPDKDKPDSVDLILNTCLDALNHLNDTELAKMRKKQPAK